MPLKLLHHSPAIYDIFCATALSTGAAFAIPQAKNPMERAKDFIVDDWTTIESSLFMLGLKASIDDI